jgi:hypothetical protein
MPALWPRSQHRQTIVWKSRSIISSPFFLFRVSDYLRRLTYVILFTKNNNNGSIREIEKNLWWCIFPDENCNLIRLVKKSALMTCKAIDSHFERFIPNICPKVVTYKSSSQFPIWRGEPKPKQDKVHKLIIFIKDPALLSSLTTFLSLLQSMFATLGYTWTDDSRGTPHKTKTDRLEQKIQKVMKVNFT